jgi:type III pantothenate kinase
VLLAIDVGNTHMVLGVYDGERLCADWRLETRPDRPADEYAVLFRALLQGAGLDTGRVNAVIVSTVVPPLQHTLSRTAERLFSVKPLFVGPGIRTGMPILYDNPREVGADRIVNAVAAFERWRQGAIVVDFGTATTFDVISPRGEYVGGAICPGIGISMDALFHHAAKLPRVELRLPEKVIGRNTVASMQSGLLYGYVGLVDGIVARMREEVDYPVKVVATGGLAPLMASPSATIEMVDELLTLKGLRLIFERNAEASGAGAGGAGGAV